MSPKRPTATAGEKMPPPIRGSAKIRVDEKGRLSIPSRFRGFFDGAGEAVLTLSPQDCLLLYSPTRFEEVESQIVALGNLNPKAMHYEEVIIGCAEVVSLDSAARLMIPSHLRERAHIERAVLAFAVGSGMRLWDEGQWEKRHEWFVAQQLEEGMSEEWQRLRI